MATFKNKTIKELMDIVPADKFLMTTNRNDGKTSVWYGNHAVVAIFDTEDEADSYCARFIKSRALIQSQKRFRSFFGIR